jgi:predicted nucleic acid-binding Zn ribbon protein
MADPSMLSMVFSQWERLVGADIAAHAKPRSLHGGVLVLEVDHPAWATQLRYMSFDIISSVNTSTKPGLVEEVRVVVGKSERQESARRQGFDTPV